MKKVIFLIGFAVSTLVANAQVLVGVNTKLNNFTLGVDANGIGYYGSLSYGKTKQGEQAPLFRYDYVAPELHPNAKHYDIASISSNETNFSLRVGKVLNNDNDFRVGVHIGLNSTQKESFNNHNDKDLGSFSILSQRVIKNDLIGGFYFNYYVGWVKVDISTNKQITTNVGLFIPLVSEKSCSKIRL